MALRDLFKKKKQAEKPIVGKKIEKAEAEKIVPQKELKRQKRDTAVVYGVVKEPHISEKATNLGKFNQYVFKVFPRADKNRIKKAIEAIYGVDVLAVNIITIPAKKRRLGRTTGFKKGHKKAIVRIKKGQKIEII